MTGKPSKPPPPFFLMLQALRDMYTNASNKV
jgi:hypothetical protein